MSGKWLGLLKELAPGLAWVALVRELLLLTESASFAAIQAEATFSSFATQSEAKQKTYALSEYFAF